MRRALLLLTPPLLVLLCWGSPLWAFEARLAGVLDGDSLAVVLADGTREEVRLIGLDAPELAQEWGREAREFSGRFCAGTRLDLALDREVRDRYGRLLAYARCDGRLLNQALLEAGLAVTLPIKPNTALAGVFRRAQAEARAEKRGFWAQGGLSMSPSTFRRRHPRQ